MADILRAVRFIQVDSPARGISIDRVGGDPRVDHRFIDVPDQYPSVVERAVDIESPGQAPVGDIHIDDCPGQTRHIVKREPGRVVDEMLHPRHAVVQGGDRLARAVRVDVHPEVVPVACVTAAELATSTARAMLPPEVPHADAAFNAGRSALLVHALSRRPDLLLPATQDRLHQAQRAAAMPCTLDLVERLRARGLAAMVSGAGPTALVLAVGDRQAASVEGIAGALWQVLIPGVDTYGTQAVTQGRLQV